MGAKREPLEIGKRYGMLVIMGEAKDRIDVNGAVNRMVFVKCDCGTLKKVFLSTVRGHRTLSCGCSKFKLRKDALNYDKVIREFEDTRLFEKAMQYSKIKELELKLYNKKVKTPYWRKSVDELFTLTNQYLNK